MTVRNVASVWHERGFRPFWIGEGLSQLGVQFALLAMPIVAVELLHASEAELGYLGAAETAAFLVVALPAGAWLDRLRKRHVMIVADVVRAAAVSLVPVLSAMDALAMWHLFVIGAVVGVATVFFDVGYQSFVPVLVSDEHVGAANGVLESTAQTMRLAGPALAGLLLKIVSAPMLLAANAVGFLLSAFALLLVRDAEVVRPVVERQHLLREIGEGLRFVVGNDFLRRIVATVALSNFGGAVMMTLAPLLILRILALDVAFYGVMLSVGAVGGLVGSVLANRIAARFGEGQTLTWSSVAFALCAALLPLAAVLQDAAVPLLIAFEAAFGFLVLVFNIVQVTARQRVCPKPLLGRMNASIRTVVWGVMPIGALASGWLGSLFGTVATMWIGLVFALASMLPLATSRYRAMRELPRRVAA